VKGHVDVYKEDRIQLEGKLGMFTSEIDKWKKGWEARDETIKQLEAKVVEKEAEKTGLNAHIAEQDIRVSTLQDRIRQLEDDLVNITQFQSETVMQALSSAQTNLNKMIGANHALQGMLIGQTKGLTMLLQQRGIASPAMNVPPTAPEITRDSIVEEIDPDEVAEAAAVSAMRALKTNDTGGSSDYDEEEERLETFDEDDEDEYYDDRSSLGEQTLD
jgi:chromosome segregation ATPase